MSDAPLEQRVGDRERRAVDEHLQAAVGDGVLTLSEYDERAAVLWQARTRSELERLVADLPSHPGPGRSVPAIRTAPERVVAVMSEDRLTGTLLPGQQVGGYALMGKAVVDLRRADLPDDVRVHAVAVMGEVEVQVPPGSRVLLSGVAVMGERKVRVVPADGPVIRVDAYAVMGTVSVTVGDGHVVPAEPSTGTVPWQPLRGSSPPVPARQRPSALARVRRRVGAALVPLALLGGTAAVLAAGEDARTVFGSTTEVVRPVGDTTVVEVSVLFGSVQVVVPDDAQVDTGGLVVFGSVNCERACTGAGTGPRVEVVARGGFGSVEVVTASEDEQRGDD